MPKEFSRTVRVADLLHRELGILIVKAIDDPRLSRVTISSVTISPDLAYAKVFITLLDEEAKIDETLAILNKAASYLRHRLAESIELRIVPRLHFVFDKSVSYSHKLSALIHEAVAKDQAANNNNE